MMQWQKIFMCIQIFEYIYSHIYTIQLRIQDENHHGFLNFLRILGHTEYQTVSVHDYAWMLFQMIMTLSVLITSKIWHKALAQVTKQEKNKKIDEITDSDTIVILNNPNNNQTTFTKPQTNIADSEVQGTKIQSDTDL